ncbi:MAG: hypothetical protein FD167_819, partial [bacterium]
LMDPDFDFDSLREPGDDDKPGNLGNQGL